MSLSSVKASADHAKAACEGFTPAKRGQLCVIERRHSYTALYGAYRGYVDYTLARVASCDSDRYVKSVDISAGQRLTQSAWSQLQLLPQSFRSEEAIAALGLGKTWETLNDAREALRAFIG